MPPPTSLKTEELRKHALICKIKKDHATAHFLTVLTGVLGPFKDACLAMLGFPRNAQPSNDHDHNYQSAQP